MMTAILDENFHIPALKATMVGDQVKIIDGAFDGAGGTIKRVNKRRQTAIIKLQLADKLIECEMMIDIVEKTSGNMDAYMDESENREMESTMPEKTLVLSYKKLWKLLIDKNMNKKDLKRVSGISTTSIAKLGKGGSITTDVLLKICRALDCKVEEIIETVEVNKMQE
jgi:DNA-binding Xre family transcriptional regulator